MTSSDPAWAVVILSEAGALWAGFTAGLKALATLKHAALAEAIYTEQPVAVVGTRGYYGREVRCHKGHVAPCRKSRRRSNCVACENNV